MAAGVARMIDRMQGNTVTIPKDRAQALSDAYLELNDYMKRTGDGVAVQFKDGTALVVTRATSVSDRTEMPETIAITRIDGNRSLEGLYEWSPKNLPPGEIRSVAPAKPVEAPAGAVLHLVAPPPEVD